MTALLAAVFAGIVAVMATLAVERFGGLLGGVLASIPTTIVPASLGFYFAGEGFEKALLAVPLGMLVNAIFLLSWRIFPSKIPFAQFGARLISMIGLSLLIWLCFALLSVWIQTNYSSLPFSFCVVLFQGVLGIWACKNNPPAPKGKNPVGLRVLFLRGLLAGSAIGFAIVISHLGALAGIASVFPAIFLTTMVSVWLAQGEAVPSGAVGPMMLGSTSVSLFALLAILFFDSCTPIGGAAIAWLLSIAFTSFPAAFWLKSISFPLQDKKM